MEGIIRSFCDLGGQIATITTTSVEELQDAVVHPEKHKNLKVHGRPVGLLYRHVGCAAAEHHPAFRERRCYQRKNKERGGAYADCIGFKYSKVLRI